MPGASVGTILERWEVGVVTERVRMWDEARHGGESRKQWIYLGEITSTSILVWN